MADLYSEVSRRWLTLQKQSREDGTEEQRVNEIRVRSLAEFAATGRTLQNDLHSGAFPLDKRPAKTVSQHQIVGEITEQPPSRPRPA